jgi:hypothetical protein
VIFVAARNSREKGRDLGALASGAFGFYQEVSDEEKRLQSQTGKEKKREDYYDMATMLGQELKVLSTARKDNLKSKFCPTLQLVI